ncbi:hypothetical protein [Sporolactobacillus inulinus]|nr:hypothetical protein [Sporolactobacillus inulinus]
MSEKHKNLSGEEDDPMPTIAKIDDEFVLDEETIKKIVASKPISVSSITKSRFIDVSGLSGQERQDELEKIRKSWTESR